MSEVTESTNSNISVDFDPILPDSGLLFYEECPVECEIQKPRLLPLKTPTQIRYEQLQHEVSSLWKDKQREAKKSS